MAPNQNVPIISLDFDKLYRWDTHLHLNRMKKNEKRLLTGKIGSLRKNHRGGILLPWVDTHAIDITSTEHNIANKKSLPRMCETSISPSVCGIYKSRYI